MSRKTVTLASSRRSEEAHRLRKMPTLRSVGILPTRQCYVSHCSMAKKLACEDLSIKFEMVSDSRVGKMPTLRHMLTRCQPYLMLLFALLLTATSTAAQPSTSQPSTAEKYIAGLRDRRFYQLATEFARRQLTDSSLSEEARLGITIELSRTHAAWALNRPPASRAADWQAAEAVLASFRQTYPDHERLLLLDLQQALNGLARAELLRQEAEVGAATSAAFEPARQVLREVIDHLETLEEQLQGAGGTTSTWPADERLALRDHVRWQLGRARKNQALCYPAASADRVAALAGALEPIEALLRELPPESSLYWPSRLESAECHRLMEDYTTASRALEAILAAEAPASISLRARGELAQLHRAQGDFEPMLDVLQQGRSIGEVTSPELDLVYLECYLSLWKRDSQANRENDAAAWLGKAERVAALMEQTHGAYWRRRADMTLASAARGGGATGNVEVLMRTADNLYVRKQYPEAISAYADAARSAEQLNDTTTALGLWKKAAAVHAQQKQPAEAAELLASAAVRLYEAAGVAEAHQSAILLAARATSADASNLPQYLSLMNQHVERWPADATTRQVRLWLGRLLEHRQQWSAAATAYMGLVEGTPQQVIAAVEGAARASAQQINSTTDAAAKEQLASEALQYFSLVARKAAETSPPANGVIQAAALQMAKFQLQYAQRVDYRRVEQTLQRVLAAESIEPAMARQAESLLIVALAAQADRRELAMGRLREMGNTQPAELLALLDQLAELSEGFNEASRREISVLIMQVCETLLQHEGQLSEEQREQIHRRQAAALVAAGRRQEALDLYARLAEGHPRDATIQEAYAQLLLESEDRTSLGKALERWRWISQHSRPATQRWWRAKYNVALAHYRLGEAEQAGKIIRYAQATGAGEPGAKLAGEMESLLRKTVGGR